MPKLKIYRLLQLLLIFVCFGSIAAEPQFPYVQLADFEWEPDGDGVQRKNIYSSPEEEGFYVYRVRFPQGVTTTPHFHSMERHVTVIEGTWYAGTDASHDMSKTIAIPAGGYMIHPAGAVHFDGALDGPVVVEIKGIGPVTTTQVETVR
jgi:quercetin dioxygenase-like cupin family protein